MNVNLDELMRLHAAATPGPWRVEEMSHILNDQVWFSAIIKAGDGLDEKIVNQGAGKADAAYIVAACNAVPELVQRVRDLETEIRRRDAEIWANLCNECAIDDFCPYCGTCPFDGKKCKEVTPEDWIRWMEENNGN